jgi:hypothetical protein
VGRYDLTVATVTLRAFTAENGLVTIDVDYNDQNNRVTAVRGVNNSTKTVDVTLSKSTGPPISATYPPGSQLSTNVGAGWNVIVDPSDGAVSWDFTAMIEVR